MRLGNQQAIDEGTAIPWTLIGAALSAMAALYVTNSTPPILLVIAVIILASRFSSRRLPSNFLITYGSRTMLLAIVIGVFNHNATNDNSPWYLNRNDTCVAGIAVAIDLALRAWTSRKPAGAREGLGVFVLMTAFCFAAATNCYYRQPIQQIAPIYLTLILLSLRNFSTMQQLPSARRAYRPGLVSFRAVVMAITIVAAAFSVWAVTRFEYQVTRWAYRWIRHQPMDRQEVGYTSTPHLSNVFNPHPSPTRVLLVDGALTDGHLRILAFETLHDGNWLSAGGDRKYNVVPTIESPQKPANPRELHFTRFLSLADVLPVPFSAVSIQSDDPLEVDRVRSVRDQHSTSTAGYDVSAVTSPTFQGPLEVPPDAEYRKTLLEIPSSIDPKVIELAKQTAGEGSAITKVMRLIIYLRSHHHYSLSYQPQGDPLNDFILNDRDAHCQYFASALAIMSRAVGVPSRYVNGFFAHEPYGDDQIVVRQRDAHAWTECWIDGIGWGTFDATPASGTPGELFGDEPAYQRWWEKLTDLPGRIRDWLATKQTIILAVVIISIGLAMIVALGRWLLRRWRPAQQILDSHLDPALLELGKRFEKQMNLRGMNCPPTSTWRVCLPEDGDARLRQFVDLYDRARFGEKIGEVAAADAALKKLESTTQKQNERDLP